MVMYAFEKLYADLVADDGTVCVVYLAWTEVLGVRMGSACVELYSPEGRREIAHAADVPAPPHPDAAEWCIRLELPDGPFELRYRVRHAGWQPACDVPALNWSVRVASAEAEARWPGQPRPTLLGRGYADWVSLGKLTRRLRLERVDWGRAHIGESSFVFNRIQHAGGGEWSRLLTTDGSIRGEWTSIAIDRHEGETLVSSPEGGPALLLSGGRVLHDGPALDEVRIPSGLARAVSRAVSPDIDETRWIRRARVPGGRAGGWALEECVRFAP
jgi:hypothetical protein